MSIRRQFLEARGIPLEPLGQKQAKGAPNHAGATPPRLDRKPVAERNERDVMRNVTVLRQAPATVTRAEFDELKAMVAALRQIVEALTAKREGHDRAAYMREYRKRQKDKIR